MEGGIFRTRHLTIEVDAPHSRGADRESDRFRFGILFILSKTPSTNETLRAFARI